MEKERKGGRGRPRGAYEKVGPSSTIRHFRIYCGERHKQEFLEGLCSVSRRPRSGRRGRRRKEEVPVGIDNTAYLRDILVGGKSGLSICRRERGSYRQKQEKNNNVLGEEKRENFLAKQNGKNKRSLHIRGKKGWLEA